MVSLAIVNYSVKLVQWNLPNPTVIPIIRMCRIRKVKMFKKTLICVERLRRIEIIPDSTGVEFGRFHCIWLKRFQPWYKIYSGNSFSFSKSWKKFQLY